MLWNHIILISDTWGEGKGGAALVLHDVIGNFTVPKNVALPRVLKEVHGIISQDYDGPAVGSEWIKQVESNVPRIAI